MKPDHLCDLRADPVNWVQGGHRFLKNHGNGIPANATHLIFSQLGQILPFKIDSALNDPARRFGNKAHDGKGGNAFAAAGLAHQPHRFSSVDLEIDSVDRLDQTLIGRKVGVQISGF